MARFLCVFLLSCWAVTASSAEIIKATKGPIFRDYGPVFKIEDRDQPIPDDFNYKVFFDITEAAEDTFSLNRRFESVARFINMHAMNGVKLENMDIAVVIHGSATRDVLTQKAYQEKYLDDNPTLDLIEKLHKKGVSFYLCGQSLYFGKFNKTDLAPQVNLALSAMTASTLLQAEGYTLIP
jgi:intracellular sulfur oxidation DsrE/DsrF family protein